MYSDLVNLALKEPIENMGTLCENNPDLIEVCSTEVFWKDRIAQDFPLYQEVIESPLTYHKYYTMLWRTLWSLRNADGSFFLTDPSTKFNFEKAESNGYQPSTFSGGLVELVYPVPRFGVTQTKKEMRIQSDISIYYMRSIWMFLIVFDERKLITGRALSNLQSKLFLDKKDYSSEMERAINYIFESRVKDKGYDRYEVIKEKDYAKFIGEVSNLGYLNLVPGTLPVNFDKNQDLFIIGRTKQKIWVGKVPIHKARGDIKLASVEQTSSPVLSAATKWKIKKLFNFLS